MMEDDEITTYPNYTVYSSHTDFGSAVLHSLSQVIDMGFLRQCLLSTNQRNKHTEVFRMGSPTPTG